MRVWRSTALLLAASCAIAACSNDGNSKNGLDHDDAKRSGGGTTTTLVAGPKTCMSTSVDDVRAVFGGPVGASVQAGLCHYDVRDGEVSFSLQRIKPGAAGTALTGVPVDGLGDLATWSAPEVGSAGLLQVRKGDAFAQFIVDLKVSEATAKARAVGWAQLVMQRIKKDPDLVPETPPTTVPGGLAHPCDVVPADAMGKIVKSEVKGIEDRQRGTCTYKTSEGGQVVVGPLSPGADPSSLADVSRIITVGTRTTEWKREEHKDVGQGAVVLYNPGQPGNAELDALIGSNLLHVSVVTIGDDAAGKRAVAVAKAAADRL